ncbi:MAG TPA: hypothetical protein VNU71_13540 [Burkholderiaceae bacterium]|nr:hypothetical protein [Burkholderiaceae bacterium]
MGTKLSLAPLNPPSGSAAIEAIARQSGVMVRLPVSDEGEVTVDYASTRNLTLADTRVLVRSNAGTVGLTLPNRSVDINPGSGNVPMLGHTFNANKPKRFRFQTWGVGSCSVNPVNGTVTISNLSNLAPEDLPRYAICTLIEIGDNAWAWV